MPAPDLAERRGRQPLTVLFWMGAALAPLAALLLLLGDSNGMLRIAAVLTLVSVVLIGLSVALRGSPDDVREEVDEALANEIGALRAELRQEIAASAHGPGQALAGRLQQLQSSVEALRGEVAAGRTAGDRPGPWQPAIHRSGLERAPAPQPATQQPGPEWAAAPQPDQRDQGRDDRSSRASGPAVAVAAFRSPDGAGTYRPPAEATDRRTGYRGGDEGQPAHRVAAARADAGRAEPPPPRPRHGVVRHTETVRVTTRQTIVDQGGDDSGTHRRYDYGDGQVYGGHADARAGSTDAAGWPSQGADAGHWPRESSGTWRAEGAPEPWHRAGGDDMPPARADAGWDRDATAPGGDGRAGWDRDATGPGGGGRDAGGWDREAAAPARGPRDDRGWTTPSPEPAAGGGRRRARPADDEVDVEAAAEGEYWSSLRTGDRWATVQRDGRGDELRMGERRAAVRADATGAEFRLEDRWAAVRRETFDRRPAGGTTGAADRGPGRAAGRDFASAEPDGRPALPASGADGRWPSARQPWIDQGPEPVRVTRRGDEWRGDERRGVERHYGQPPSGDMPRAGGARPPEPGFFDEGWH